jgi:hypothetical protein
MAIGHRLRAADDYVGQVAIGVRNLQIFSGEQEHDIGSEIDPPIRRLDFCDRGCIGIGDLLRERWRREENRRGLQCEKEREVIKSRDSTRRPEHKHFPASLADLKSRAA